MANKITQRSTRLTEREDRQLLASAAWRGVAASGVVRDSLKLYMLEQARVLLAADHPSAIRDLPPGETSEDALADLARRRADLVAEIFEERVAPEGLALVD